MLRRHFVKVSVLIVKSTSATHKIISISKYFKPYLSSQLNHRMRLHTRHLKCFVLQICVLKQNMSRTKPHTKVRLSKNIMLQCLKKWTLMHVLSPLKRKKELRSIVWSVKQSFRYYLCRYFSDGCLYSLQPFIDLT